MAFTLGISISLERFVTNISRVKSTINLVPIVEAQGKIISDIVIASLNVPGFLGILAVLPNNQCTLKIAKNWNIQRGIRGISMEFLEDLSYIVIALHSMNS